MVILEKYFVLFLVSFIIISNNGISGEAGVQKKTLQGLGCKDEAGNHVDWFLVYKLPRNPQSADPALATGGAYFFLTPNSVGWERSKYLIDQPASILGITLQPLYDNNSDVGYILYNDQPPDAHPVLYGGHTKGVILTSSAGGLWLPHSVPHFPNVLSSVHYPPGGHENGQIFLCLSLNVSMVDSIGEALEYTKPQVYKYALSESLRTLHPKLTQVVVNNATKTTGPWFTKLVLQAGEPFTVFVKGPKFRKEIYADWIAPELSTSLDVQSWLNGAHSFNSNCTSKQYPVYNIESKTISGIQFSTTNDHSKWGVGTNQSVTCIADLNRTKPQKSRGGLALCVTNKVIWNALKASVTDLQPCNQPHPRLKHKARKNKSKNRSYQLTRHQYSYV